MTEYRYSSGGRVKHALDSPSETSAWCGFEVFRSSDWHGTGSQVEYEVAASLPMCKNCERMRAK